MNYRHEEVFTGSRITITNLLQEIGPAEVRDEIVAGLRAEQKAISSKYFYNREGSILFEEITRLDEYYPGRTEKEILKQVAPVWMKKYGEYEIIELGPGDHSKISILLNAASGLNLESIRYLPLDISQPAIRNSAEKLVSLFSNLHVEGYAVDFVSQFEPVQRNKPALVCFFGGTIGNFDWDEALELLSNISRQMKKEDVLLLGMDLVKPETLLHAAYNDSRGVTAAFNRNILRSINELIQSDFNPADFEHLAFFNKEKSRIEMHLAARQDLVVRSPCFEEDLFIRKNETIHTENSHKYSEAHIRELARASGLDLLHTHSDEKGWFALSEFRKI